VHVVLYKELEYKRIEMYKVLFRELECMEGSCVYTDFECTEGRNVQGTVQSIGM